MNYVNFNKNISWVNLVQYASYMKFILSTSDDITTLQGDDVYVQKIFLFHYVIVNLNYFQIFLKFVNFL